MPTVCFCNGNLAWGGGETWHLNAARSLAARSWRVLLICHPDGELHARALRVPGITVVPMRLGRLSFLNPLVASSLTRFFRAEQPRAVIMNLPSDLKAAGPAARRAGVRHVIYRRGSALPVRAGALNRWLYGTVITRLIVNSQATRNLVLADDPHLIASERITVLANGIDIADFDAALNAAAKSALAKPASAGQRPFILGTAGRLNRQKAQHLLLHLGARLKTSGFDFQIRIAGVGERADELAALAVDLGLAGQVEFLGFMEDLASFWNGIDLFVLPSLWEGFGNVVIEAGLARKPVFAFAVSNLPELIIDGVNGRLFPLPPEERGNAPCGGSGMDTAKKDDGAEKTDSMGLMADAVIRLAEDERLREAMGRAGRERALHFSQDACMDVLEALLD